MLHATSVEIVAHHIAAELTTESDGHGGGVDSIASVRVNRVDRTAVGNLCRVEPEVDDEGLYHWLAMVNVRVGADFDANQRANPSDWPAGGRHVALGE